MVPGSGYAFSKASTGFLWVILIMSIASVCNRTLSAVLEKKKHYQNRISLVGWPDATAAHLKSVIWSDWRWLTLADAGWDSCTGTADWPTSPKSCRISLASRGMTYAKQSFLVDISCERFIGYYWEGKEDYALSLVEVPWDAVRRAALCHHLSVIRLVGKYLVGMEDVKIVKDPSKFSIQWRNQLIYYALSVSHVYWSLMFSWYDKRNCVSQFGCYGLLLSVS